MNFRRALIFAFAIFSLICASCSDMTQDAPFVLPIVGGVTSGGSDGSDGIAVSGGGSGGNSGGIGETAAAQKYASVTGTAFASGAFPEEIAARVSGTAGGAKAKGGAEISKSAFPQMAGADLQGFAYKFTAVKVGDESVYYEAAQDDISVSAEGLVSFGVNIPVLDAAVQYKIVCEAYLDAAMTKPVLKGESQKFEIGRESQTASASVPLGAFQESGCMGSVELLVALESGAESAIDSATMTISGLSSIAGVLSGSEYKFSSDANAVPCGAHSARFSFKKGSQEVYAFTQIVNVYQYLETKTWVQNGAEPYFNTTVGSDGKKTTTCALTAAMLESWTLTEFFVDDTRSDDPADSNYTTQSGTFVNPCLTFDGAIAKLVDSSKDYTIFINGTVKGAQTVPNTIQAKTLTICGANGLYSSGENAGQPKDTLKYQSQGLPNSNLTTLSVCTTVPVFIKNLKITGGYGREIDGNNTAGGILVGLDSTSLGNVAADVTLLDGTLVTGNEATFGGGVCLMKGSLKIKGAVISGNSGTNGGGVNIAYGSSAIFYSGSIESNTVNDSGGGVCLGGSLEMHSGAVIKQNQAKDASSNWGGGVYVSNGASLTITGGEISANSGSDGGGVYNDGGSVAFNSGLIKSNSAAFYGGGVCNSSGSFDMKDGASITQNSTDDKGDGSLSSGGGVFVEGGSFAVSGGTISANTTNGKGGAVYMYDGTFSMSGSVSIPYGTGNDVFLESDQTISIAASLTATAPVATITPHEYVDGTPILSLAEPSSTTIGAERAKFSIKQQSEQLEIFDISNEGYLTNVIFSFDSSFPNGTVYGTEIHEDKTYAVIKYSYLNYDNLSMNITNPFADLGWNMEFKLDGVSTDPASATTLADGYHTLSATLAKGSESVTATTRVHAMIKPVKVTIGTIEVYFDTNGEGAHGGGQAYISYPPCTPHYMYIEGDPYPNEASKKKTCRTVSDNSNDWRSEGTSNSVTYRYIPDSENNFVYLTEKTSNFYFYTNMAHCTYSGLDLCQIRRTDTTTTRALSALKPTDGRSFATGDVNWDGVHVSGGGCPRGYYSFDVTPTED